jgi:hypothetical protein
MREPRILQDDHDTFAYESVADDGYHLHVLTRDGRQLELRRSFEAGEFFLADVTRLVGVAERTVEPGQKNLTRRRHLRGEWWVYLHVNTGPPTWWFPHVQSERYGRMVGWMRGLVAVVVRRETPREP